MEIRQEKLKAHYDKNKGHDVLKVVETISLKFKNINELSNHIYSTLFDIDKKEGYFRKNLDLISKHIASIIIKEGQNFGDGFNWIKVEEPKQLEFNFNQEPKQLEFNFNQDDSLLFPATNN